MSSLTTLVILQIACTFVLSQYYPFKLGLWHEGIVGKASTDESTYYDMEQTVIDFAVSKNIDTIFVPVGSPDSSDFSNSTWVYNGFLSKLKSPMEAGAVGYIRPKDSSWTMYDNLPGGYNTCTLIPPNGPCPATDSPPYPQGCPNDLTQQIAYIGSINDMSSDVKFSTLAFDHEDMGPYASKWGMCQGQQAFKLYAPDLVDIGFAGGAALTPDQINSTVSYPEFYNIGDLALSGCNSSTHEQAPYCTNGTVYCQYANQPQAFLDYMAPLIYDQYAPYVNQKGVWVTFSIEYLEYGLDGTGPSCISSEYYGSTDYNQDVCGTFNGFSCWDFESFIQFLTLFQEKYEANNFAIYEAQFIPSTWR